MPFCRGKNSVALQVVVKLADWAVGGLEKLNEQQFQKMLNCEHGGMCKVFADLYEITGEKKYLKLAQRFIHQEIYKPLSEEKLGRDTCETCNT